MDLVEKTLNHTHERNANENYLRYQLSSIRLAKTKKPENSLSAKLSVTAGVGVSRYNLLKGSQLYICFTSNSPSKNLFCRHTPTCAKWHVYSDTHCTVICDDRNWSQPQHPLGRHRFNKSWFIHTVQCHAAVESSAGAVHVTAWEHCPRAPPGSTLEAQHDINRVLAGVGMLCSHTHIDAQISLGKDNQKANNWLSSWRGAGRPGAGRGRRVTTVPHFKLFVNFQRLYHTHTLTIQPISRIDRS